MNASLFIINIVDKLAKWTHVRFSFILQKLYSLLVKTIVKDDATLFIQTKNRTWSSSDVQMTNNITETLIFGILRVRLHQQSSDLLFGDGNSVPLRTKNKLAIKYCQKALKILEIFVGELLGDSIELE